MDDWHLIRKQKAIRGKYLISLHISHENLSLFPDNDSILPAGGLLNFREVLFCQNKMYFRSKKVLQRHYLWKFLFDFFGTYPLNTNSFHSGGKTN